MSDEYIQPTDGLARQIEALSDDRPRDQHEARDDIRNRPECPACGNNRQVWREQFTGVWRCHRAGCDREIEDVVMARTPFAPLLHVQSLEAERDAAVARGNTLRAALVEVYRLTVGIPAGVDLSQGPSDAFLCMVPDELRLVLEKLRRT